MSEIEVPLVNHVRVTLSSNCLYSAFSSAALCLDLESSGDRTDEEIRLRHRSLVINSVTSAVAFLESCVNELFSSAAEDGFGFRFADEEARRRLAGVWAVERFRLSRVLEKYEVALQLVEAPAFDRGAKTYQEASLLVQLRNALLHYSPSTLRLEGGATVDPDPDNFAKRLKGRFPENPWAAKYMLITTDVTPVPTVWPFFPERCLGAGCAAWAAQAALGLADEFFERLGVEPSYAWVRGHLAALNGLTSASS
ncbi:MAG: hypothetical protein FDZ75_00535 [Actinobacteria bacterium]|nr:MAG: hypothetical protein FDZ75_00535 [Actinomycetota bacterium]